MFNTESVGSLLHSYPGSDGKALFKLLESLPVAAYTCDPEGLITYFNYPAEQLWGKKPKLNSPDDRYCGSFRLFSADGQLIRHDECWMAKSLRLNQPFNQQQIMVERPNGERVAVLAHANPLHDLSGNIIGAVNILIDISENQSAMQKYAAAESRLHRYSRIFEDSLNEIYTFDVDTLRFQQVNAVVQKNLGYTQDELHQLTPLDLKPEFTREQYEQMIEPLRLGTQKKVVFETVQKRKDGTLYDVEVHLQIINDHNDPVFVAIILDITARKQTERLLQHQANHDALTGLTNRREFELQANVLLQGVKHAGEAHALCFLDLDQFKVVNDTCGHSAGDELLRQLSAILKNTVRNKDILARLGGDEFGVLIRDVTGPEAMRAAGHLQQAIQDFQFSWDTHTFKVGVSIGLVPISTLHTNVGELLKLADTACYLAKESGRNRIHLYHPDDKEVKSREGEMQWVSRMHKALRDNRFHLFTQAVVPVNKRLNRFYEVMIRMTDESGNVISPEFFLPASERYGLITKLDSWVIKKAMDTLVANPAFLESIDFCAINLSGPSLNNSAVLQLILEQLKETGIPGNKLCFEITETAAVANLTLARNFIFKLKAIGCHFALDDFGSGLSSFTYLKNLPVDFLKIDGSFVKDIVKDPIDFAMVKSINEIGHVMNIKTVAEHVENDEIRVRLEEIGVDYVQGYGVEIPLAFDRMSEAYSFMPEPSDLKQRN